MINKEGFIPSTYPQPDSYSLSGEFWRAEYKNKKTGVSYYLQLVGKCSEPSMWGNERTKESNVSNIVILQRLGLYGGTLLPCTIPYTTRRFNSIKSALVYLNDNEGLDLDFNNSKRLTLLEITEKK